MNIVFDQNILDNLGNGIRCITKGASNKPDTITRIPAEQKLLFFFNSVN
jgi:hypothetical protein